MALVSQNLYITLKLYAAWKFANSRIQANIISVCFTLPRMQLVGFHGYLVQTSSVKSLKVVLNENVQLTYSLSL